MTPFQYNDFLNRNTSNINVFIPCLSDTHTHLHKSSQLHNSLGIEPESRPKHKTFLTVYSSLTPPSRLAPWDSPLLFADGIGSIHFPPCGGGIVKSLQHLPGTQNRTQSQYNSRGSEGF